MRIALEAKRQLGLPIDESDYADLQTKETKLREVTNMENYVKNAASSYGRDSSAMMEEMLKLNGCSSVAELQEKVANGEKIIEAVDTAWSKDIQKQHYAGYDAMIAARNAEASLMNLNASLRGAELGTHGDTNALWAKQNIQGGNVGAPIPEWVKYSADLSMTAPLAVAEAFPIGSKGPIPQPAIGGAVISYVTHTGIDTLNYIAGHGDGYTLGGNALANVISTTAGTGAQLVVANAYGKVFGAWGAPLGPVGVGIGYVAGFGVSWGVSRMGLNEPIEQGLRDLQKNRARMQREQLRNSNSWTGVRG